MSGGANKAGTGSTTNTGQPNWTSGATGNNMMAAPSQNAVQGGTGLPTASGAGGGVAPQGSAGMSGDWSTPGTEGYNNMNNLLTTQPMGNLVNILQQGGMGSVMSDVMKNLASSSGSNDWMQGAAGMFGQGGQQFGDLYNKAGQPGGAEQYLTDTASGKMLSGNPYIDAIVNKGQEEAGTGINQMFAQGGRYGSPTNYGTIADSYQDIGNKFRGQEYENERGRQMTAAGAIGQEQLGRLGVQNNALTGFGNMASGLGGLGQGAMENWMNAQGGAASLENQGIQNQFGAMNQLSNVQNNKMFDSNAQLQVGNETTQASQNQLNDLINQWTQGDMSGWARLGGLLSAATGSAGSYGTGTSSQKQTQSPGILSILGALASL